MSWFLKLVPPQAMAIIIAALIALLGVTVLGYTLALRGTAKQLATANSNYATAAASLKVCEANEGLLKAAVARQNQATALLRAQAEAANLKAAARARAVIAAQKEDSTKPGAGGMSQWAKDFVLQ